jgi:hypothetical protein
MNFIEEGNRGGLTIPEMLNVGAGTTLFVVNFLLIIVMVLIEVSNL